MPTSPSSLPYRFKVLLLFNVASNVFLWALSTVIAFVEPWNLLVASTSFCLNPLFWICVQLGFVDHRSFLLPVFLLGAGPVLWAGTIELLLRRFVDPPDDSCGG